MKSTLNLEDGKVLVAVVNHKDKSYALVAGIIRNEFIGDDGKLHSAAPKPGTMTFLVEKCFKKSAGIAVYKTAAGSEVEFKADDEFLKGLKPLVAPKKAAVSDSGLNVSAFGTAKLPTKKQFIAQAKKDYPGFTIAQYEQFAGDNADRWR